MPYIKDEENRRELLLDSTLVGPENAGELNYVLTMTCVNYLMGSELSYARINDVLGALEGAKQEFYRRVAVPYEDRAIMRNGDVFPPELFEPVENTFGFLVNLDAPSRRRLAEHLTKIAEAEPEDAQVEINPEARVQGK